MDIHMINKVLLDLFGSKFEPSKMVVWGETMMDSILTEVEDSLPDLEKLPAVQHWPGQLHDPKHHVNTEIYGTILSGFYEVNIVNMKYRIIVYLNQTGQVSTKYFKIVNHFINDVSYKWHIDKFMDEWIDNLMSEADKKLLSSTISSIQFQLYRNGMKFVYSNAGSFLVDSRTYKAGYKSMADYLKKFNLYTTDQIADDMLFISKNKFVSLGHGYKTKGLKKVNAI